MAFQRKLSMTRQMAESYYKNGTWPPDKWDYSIGVVLLGYLRLDEALGTDIWTGRVLEYCKKLVNPNGIIHTYIPYIYNIDHVNTGKIFYRLLETNRDSRWEKALRAIRGQLETHPRTRDNIFWHKMIYPHQVWLDGLYMGLPFLAEWGKTFGEKEVFDDITAQIENATSHLYDKKTGLYYHGWDQSGGMKWSQPQNNCSPNFWGRSMGWLVMALVDVLCLMPPGHEGITRIRKILESAIMALVKVADGESGVWYQVLDQGKREGNYLESSASCMIAYSIARAVSKGHLPDKYLPAAKKAWEGIKKQFVCSDARGMRLANSCKVAGLGGYPYRDGSYEYYLGEPIVDDDDKGIGAFILAGTELEE
ncbi:MAG: glycosyl hydrolase family 88 [Spirochaetaceae bacterium]|nr:MAG: glycosyl hydrolase family 88 [Spirochaetaceae bacterium]